MPFYLFFIFAMPSVDKSISYTAISTSLGIIGLGATDAGICFLQICESEGIVPQQIKQQYGEQVKLHPFNPAAAQLLVSSIDALQSYLDGQNALPDIPTDVKGTPLQHAVWDYLRTIPLGEVVSYSDVAEGVGKPEAVRAVANACGANPVAILVPCHRVLRKNGGMGGYRWGLACKIALITLEQRLAMKFQQPVTALKDIA